MKKFCIVAASAAISAVTAAPLAAGTIDAVVEEEDPYVAPAAGSRWGAIAAIGGGALIACALLCDSGSSSTGTTENNQ